MNIHEFLYEYMIVEHSLGSFMFRLEDRNACHQSTKSQ